MRALLITPVLPSATGNGLSMRAGLWLEALARHFDVDLLITPFFPAHDSAAEFTGRHVSTAALLGGQASAMFGMPRTVPTLDDESKALLRERIEAADVVVVFRLYLAGLAQDARSMGIPVIVDLDDLDWVREERLGQVEEARAYRNYASAILGLADVATTASAQDATLGSGIHAGPTWLQVPNAVRTPDVTDVHVVPQDIDLLFVATLGYEPNAEAARWLVNEVLPLIPDASVAIVGAAPGPDVLALASANVQVVADVADVTPWYERSRIAVVPIHSGAGTRTKIPEAWAHHRPVVTTTIGAEGLECADAAVIADDARDFAAACARLLGDGPARQLLADRGRERFEREHTLEWACEHVDRTLEAALGMPIADATQRASRAPLPDEAAPTVEPMSTCPRRRDGVEISPAADGYLARVPGSSIVTWLNRTGYLILELCSGSNDANAIAAAIADAYDLALPPVVTTQTAIAELVAAGLVIPGAPEPAVSANVRVSVWMPSTSVDAQVTELIGQLSERFAHAAVPATFVMERARSLRVARNLAADGALVDPSITHVLYVDATVAALTEVLERDLPRLVGSAHEVIGIPVPILEPRWDQGMFAARQLPDLTPRELEQFSAQYDCSFLNALDPDLAVDGFLEARHCGSHALLVRRSAFERIAGSGAAPANRGYIDHGYVELTEGWGFFDPGKSQDGIDIDEDFAFCDRMRTAGGRVMVDVTGGFGVCLNVGKRLQALRA